MENRDFEALEMYVMNWISQVSEMLKDVPKAYIETFMDVLDYSAKAAAYPENRKKEAGNEEKEKPRLMPLS